MWKYEPDNWNEEKQELYDKEMCYLKGELSDKESQCLLAQIKLNSYLKQAQKQIDIIKQLENGNTNM